MSREASGKNGKEADGSEREREKSYLIKFYHPLIHSYLAPRHPPRIKMYEEFNI
jgi:hypothetical protein